MSIPDDDQHELTADELELARMLERRRPAPAPMFRTDLWGRLRARGLPRSRPARLRELIAAYALGGGALLLIGLLSAAGLGPLAT